MPSRCAGIRMPLVSDGPSRYFPVPDFRQLRTDRIRDRPLNRRTEVDPDVALWHVRCTRVCRQAWLQASDARLDSDLHAQLANRSSRELVCERQPTFPEGVASNAALGMLPRP